MNHITNALLIRGHLGIHVAYVWNLEVCPSHFILLLVHSETTGFNVIACYGVLNEFSSLWNIASLNITHVEMRFLNFFLLSIELILLSQFLRCSKVILAIIDGFHCFPGQWNKVLWLRIATSWPQREVHIMRSRDLLHLCTCGISICSTEAAFDLGHSYFHVFILHKFWSWRSPLWISYIVSLLISSELKLSLSEQKACLLPFSLALVLVYYWVFDKVFFGDALVLWHVVAILKVLHFLLYYRSVHASGISHGRSCILFVIIFMVRCDIFSIIWSKSEICTFKIGLCVTWTQTFITVR